MQTHTKTYWNWKENKHTQKQTQTSFAWLHLLPTKIATMCVIFPVPKFMARYTVDISWTRIFSSWVAPIPLTNRKRDKALELMISSLSFPQYYFPIVSLFYQVYFFSALLYLYGGIRVFAIFYPICLDISSFHLI